MSLVLDVHIPSYGMWPTNIECITGVALTWPIRRLTHMKQDLLSLPAHLISPPNIGFVDFTQSKFSLLCFVYHFWCPFDIACFFCSDLYTTFNLKKSRPNQNNSIILNDFDDDDNDDFGFGQVLPMDQHEKICIFKRNMKLLLYKTDILR